MVIDVPPDSQVHRQVVRKRAEVHAIRVDPVVRLHFIEVAPPDMHEPAGDLRRVEAALREEWGVEGVRCDLAVLGDPPDDPALRRVAGHRGGARRGATSSGSGRASGTRHTGGGVDVGSTTIAAHLCELSSGESSPRPAR